MTLANYISLIKTFFFKKAHTFTVHLGAEKVTVAVSVESPDAVHVPYEITLADAMTLVELIQNHADAATSLSFNAYVDGNIEVTVTISKI